MQKLQLNHCNLDDASRGSNLCILKVMSEIQAMRKSYQECVKSKSNSEEFARCHKEESAFWENLELLFGEYYERMGYTFIQFIYANKILERYVAVAIREKDQRQVTIKIVLRRDSNYDLREHVSCPKSFTSREVDHHDIAMRLSNKLNDDKAKVVEKFDHFCTKNSGAIVTGFDKNFLSLDNYEKMSENQAKLLTVNLACLLHHLNENKFYHLDLKPANLLVNAYMDIILIDFTHSLSGIPPN